MSPRFEGYQHFFHVFQLFGSAHVRRKEEQQPQALGCRQLGEPSESCTFSFERKSPSPVSRFWTKRWSSSFKSAFVQRFLPSEKTECSAVRDLSRHCPAASSIGLTWWLGLYFDTKKRFQGCSTGYGGCRTSGPDNLAAQTHRSPGFACRR
jgi:hypothetical protein